MQKRSTGKIYHRAKHTRTLLIHFISSESYIQKAWKFTLCRRETFLDILYRGKILVNNMSSRYRLLPKLPTDSMCMKQARQHQFEFVLSHEPDMRTLH